MSLHGPAVSTVETAGGEFFGHATRRIANDDLWVEVLATAGPRIVRAGMTGSSRNLLAETPDAGWGTPYGRYELFGGHRLWFAPEDPDRVAMPDVSGLALGVEPDAARWPTGWRAPTIASSTAGGRSSTPPPVGLGAARDVCPRASRAPDLLRSYRSDGPRVDGQPARTRSTNRPIRRRASSTRS